MELTIWSGILVTALLLTLIKAVLYRFDPNRKPFKLTFFTLDSWLDYIIHISITVIFFIFEKDALAFINPLLGSINENLSIPSPENKGFLFIVVPVLVSTVGYKLARKHISKPLQDKVVQSRMVKKMAPKAQAEYCEHKMAEQQ